MFHPVFLCSVFQYFVSLVDAVIVHVLFDRLNCSGFPYYKLEDTLLYMNRMHSAPVTQNRSLSHCYRNWTNMVLLKSSQSSANPQSVAVTGSGVKSLIVRFSWSVTNSQINSLDIYRTSMRCIIRQFKDF